VGEKEQKRSEVIEIGESDSKQESEKNETVV